MSRPVVGLTCYVERARWNAWDERAALIGVNYLRSLNDAGARVVVLPPDLTPDPTRKLKDDPILDRIDGLVLAGGPDIESAPLPELDADPNPTEPASSAGDSHKQRDVAELALYRNAIERNLPVLGICRGLQIMAIATGGSLHQHLPDLVGSTLHRNAPGTFTDHGATFAPGSLIAKITGRDRATVNSSHHQAVADPGSLTVTGWAEDGTIEVAEDPRAYFALGVQWHPEAANNKLSARLFGAFVSATGQWAGRN